jgi:NAD+ synthase
MEKTRSFDISSLRLKVDKAKRLLEGFVRDELTKAGFHKAVIGLSGGVDSALSAAISANALGPDNVLGVIMPYKQSNPESRKHALLVAERLGIRTREIDITPMVDPYFEQYEPEADNVRRGNVMARQRMIVLYDISYKEHALVVGTSNRTEMLLGYTTLWGDMANAVNPLGDLLKTQVWQLAGEYDLPEEVIGKAPSADLWEDQTDEGELGFSYVTADTVIALMVDNRIPAKRIPSYGIDEKVVDRILHLMRVNQFKRMPPLIAKLSHRTVGRDWRYPRDWGL